MDHLFVIVDYGMGNLKSVENALRFLGCTTIVSSKPSDILRADAIILPGVGAFGQAMHNLKEMDLIAPLHTQVMDKKKPFLGICLGMQLIALDSEEGGLHKGFGWVSGNVRKLKVSKDYRLPHIGWNDINIRIPKPLFDRLEDDVNFFFVHSYHIECDKQYISATVRYDVEVTAALQKDNIYATQFHPEKSQKNGLKVLRNFITLADQPSTGER